MVAQIDRNVRLGIPNIVVARVREEYENYVYARIMDGFETRVYGLVVSKGLAGPFQSLAQQARVIAKNAGVGWSTAYRVLSEIQKQAVDALLRGNRFTVYQVARLEYRGGKYHIKASKTLRRSMGITPKLKVCTGVLSLLKEGNVVRAEATNDITQEDMDIFNSL